VSLRKRTVPRRVPVEPDRSTRTTDWTDVV
jgi:hypothetical protein